jgi:hypothetical protein
MVTKSGGVSPGGADVTADTVGIGQSVHGFQFLYYRDNATIAVGFGTTPISRRQRSRRAHYLANCYCLSRSILLKQSYSPAHRFSLSICQAESTALEWAT